jgi:hypothetical protein
MVYHHLFLILMEELLVQPNTAMQPRNLEVAERRGRLAIGKPFRS